MTKPGWIGDDAYSLRFLYNGATFQEDDIIRILYLLDEIGGFSGAQLPMKEPADFIQILREMIKTFRKHGYVPDEIELT